MQKDLKLVIIDYDLSNLYSVVRVCELLGYQPILTKDSKEIKQADAVILPGVGAFGEAMNNLKNLGFIDPIYKYVEEGKPFMGVCLGLQLLFEESEEFGIHKGLGLIKGRVKKFTVDFEQNIKVPQIAWNTIKPHTIKWKNTPLKSVVSGAFMYFVHSYYVAPTEEENILSETTYGDLTYCSSVQKENIFATQFHPEKSGEKGLSIYKNWLNSIK